jgi:hypothetical protein
MELYDFECGRFVIKFMEIEDYGDVGIGNS